MPPQVSASDSNNRSRNAENQPEMSAATRNTLAKVREFIPPLMSHFHKGQLGRVAVLGGSASYTGAPFFSANASALLGADLSHVICEPTAAQVIKTYSPNLMVHPLMRESTHSDASASSIADQIAELLPRLHAVVLGPGLGRDPLMLDTAGEVVRRLRDRNMPFVMDADALGLVQRDSALVHGYKECILTPNVMEFARLCKAVGVDTEGPREEQCRNLARALGGVMVVQKGKVDYISDGETVRVVDVEGGRKRSGGQGDTLTGAMVTMLAWRAAYLERLWEHDNSLDKKELLMLAAFGASAITRTCSRRAFEKKGRALQASDLSTEVPEAFLELFGEKDVDEDRHQANL